MKVTISAGYGVVSKIHPTGHTGIDYAVPLGTPLHAPYDGIVTAVRDYGSSSLGKSVFVQKADGTLYTLGHLSDIKVKIGQKVAHGDLLAFSGSTGRSTGPHLHYGEFTSTGQPIDPGDLPFDAFTPYPGWTQHFRPLLEANERFFQNWFSDQPQNYEAFPIIVEKFVDLFIFLLPELIAIGMIYYGFKIMLAPLFK